MRLSGGVVSFVMYGVVVFVLLGVEVVVMELDVMMFFIVMDGMMEDEKFLIIGVLLMCVVG